ncbi:MAG: fibronectin type III domain-containing protein, partial [Acutalibacteraceae bacterium]
MKKVSTKILSLLLSLVLILGTVTVAFAADEQPAAPTVTYDSKYFQFTSNDKNAKNVLDKLDATLKEADMEPMVLEVGLYTFTIDFTSVNGICKTIDTVYGLWGDYDVFGTWWPRLGSKTLVGDLGGQDGLEFKNWTKGMTREKTGDVKIIEKLITLVSDNSHIIAKFIEGNIDLGTLGDVLKAMDVDINDMFPEGGFNTILKQGLVSAVYDEGTPEYNAAYEKAMNSLDDFFYEDMLSDLFQEILPGLTINGKTTFDELLKSVFKISWDNYLVKLISGINVDLKGSDNEALKKLGEIMNLDGHTIKTDIPFDESKSFTDQINNIAGYMVGQFFPKYTGWVEGGADKLGANLNALYLYAAKELGITDGIDTNDSSAVALAVVKFVLANIESDEMDEYIAGIDSCKTLQDVAVVVLRNTAKINDIPVTSDTKATYENLLGDFLTFYVGKAVVLSYDAGAGIDVWTVLNDIANVFLYDKGFAAALNMTTTKDKDIFTKLDELIAKTKIFDGLTGTNDYSSKTFLTGLIDSLFTLDIAKLVDITAVTFLKDFADKSVSYVVYDSIYNFLYNWLGKDILVKRSATSTKPLDDSVTNENLQTMVVNLLTSINSKKSALLPVILYIGALVIGESPAKYEFTLDNREYTGSKLEPGTPKVTLDGKAYTLKAGRDYDIISVTGDLVNPGTVTAKINFYGYVKTTQDVTYNITLPALKNLKATATTNSATLTWDKVPGAQKYEVLNGTKVLATVTTNSAKVSLTTATEYKLSVRAVYGSVTSAAASVTVITLPNKASTPKASSITDTSLKLSWTATTNATGYVVERLNGSTWTKVATVTTNSYTVKSLKAKTTYQFRIRAYKKGSSTVYGAYSSTVKATTLLSATTLKASSVTDTTMKLSWSKVTGAEGYVIEQYNGKTWTTLKKTTSTSYSVTKLKANTTYQYRIRAYYKSGSTTVYGVYSSVLKISTAPAKVTSVKLSSATSTTLKVSWKAASGASGYKVYYSTNNKSWKSVSTTKTSVTLTKLSSNKKYYVKVLAYKKTGTVTALGQYSSTVTASTTVAQVTGLKASKTTKDSVTLSWSKVSGASGYTIYRQSGSKWVKVATVKTTSYTNTKLSRNTSYKYYVVAYKTVSKKAVYGDKSATLTARTKLL